MSALPTLAPVTIPGSVAVAGSGSCSGGRQRCRLRGAPDWTPSCQAPFTGAVPPARTDSRLLIGAGAAAVLAGLVVAVVLLLATSQADQPKTYQPFAAGPRQQLGKNLA